MVAPALRNFALAVGALRCGTTLRCLSIVCSFSARRAEKLHTDNLLWFVFRSASEKRTTHLAGITLLPQVMIAEAHYYYTAKRIVNIQITQCEKYHWTPRSIRLSY